jgi:hypothetical protein
MDTLTSAQAKMLETIDSIVVRRSYGRDGQPLWLFEGRRATAGEARVITSLQTKKLVKVVSQQVHIAGWNGTKAVGRLVRK